MTKPVTAKLVVAALCAVVVLFAHRGAVSDDERGTVSRAAVQEAIDASAQYLVRAARNDGSFDYRVNMNPAVTVKPRYNLLRHAGSVFAMTMYLAEQQNEAVQEAALRAGAYLKGRAIAPVPGEGGLLAVWSRPEITNTNKPLQAKLGGTGLGLVALAGLEKIQRGFTSLDDLRALGRFIVSMQKPDGSFYSKYIPSTGGRDDSWTSLYYPGEAALGLLMLYDLDRDGRWLHSAGDALDYLAQVRKGATNVPADHWALLATAKLLSLRSADLAAARRARLIGHAIQICTAILAQQVDDPGSGALHGGFKNDGRVTPTATRLEGLLAARSFLTAGSDLANEIDVAVAKGIAFLMRAQISEGDFAGGFPRAIAPLPPSADGADRFNRRATEVRIDYVQHALSALIQYRATLPPRS